MSFERELRRLIAQLEREREETVQRNDAAIAEIDRAIKINQDELERETQKKNP
jgi:hypothetical protein